LAKIHASAALGVDCGYKSRGSPLPTAKKSEAAREPPNPRFDPTNAQLVEFGSGRWAAPKPVNDTLRGETREAFSPMEHEVDESRYTAGSCAPYEQSTFKLAFEDRQERGHRGLLSSPEGAPSNLRAGQRRVGGGNARDLICTLQSTRQSQFHRSGTRCSGSSPWVFRMPSRARLYWCGRRTELRRASYTARHVALTAASINGALACALTRASTAGLPARNFTSGLAPFSSIAGDAW
jgi:hypothetical protein